VLNIAALEVAIQRESNAKPHIHYRFERIYMATTFDLDDTDWSLLRELQANGRITLSELSRRVGLTAPAVGERMRRLEEAGIIRGYHAVVDLEKVGRMITAFVRLRFAGGKYDAFKRVVERTHEILECHHVAGEDCFIIKVAVARMADLERLASSLSRFGSTATSIVYSTTFDRRIVDDVSRAILSAS
jgi:Lrp/AsnC family leucine-responsive transcriptional regulator